MSEPELKPCPFCGGAEVRAQQNGLPRNRFWECACDDCDFCGPAFDTKDEAVSHWNTRADFANAVKVKPLEVEERRHRRLGLGPYEISPNGPDIDGGQYWRVRLHGKVILKKIKGVERAAQWVQKHHADAILSAIDTDNTLTDLLKAEREKALREVLSKISGWTDQKHIAEDMKHVGFPNRTTQAYAIERIVRALIDKPEGEG